MTTRLHPSEEHELPGVEAVLAGTLALMTGYSQALQAAAHPAQRVLMGAKIGRHLALLVDHPLLSPGFQQVLAGLERRWASMNDCTDAAARDCTPRGSAHPLAGAEEPPAAFCLAAPQRLQ